MNLANLNENYRSGFSARVHHVQQPGKGQPRRGHLQDVHLDRSAFQDRRHARRGRCHECN